MNTTIPDVLVCRFGHHHRGMYRYEDWLKCQCDHQYPDMIETVDDGEAPAIHICMECGQTWRVDTPKVSA